MAVPQTGQAFLQAERMGLWEVLGPVSLTLCAESAGCALWSGGIGCCSVYCSWEELLESPPGWLYVQ